MKIGILTWDLALRGGTQRQVVELARQLRQGGDEVIVYAVYFDPKVYPDILERIPVRSLFPGERIARGINEKKVLGIYVRALPLLLDEWRWATRIAAWIPADLDVLNPHDNHVFQAAAEWKRRSGKPVLWMMNDFPTVVLPAARFRKPVLNRLYDSVNGKRMIRRWYERSMRAIDRIVVLDDRISRRYLEEQFALRPVTIRSGLDLSKFVYLPREPFTGGRPFRIFSNGIMVPHRRLEDVVEAVRIARDMGTELVWTHVGSEELDREYAAKVREHVRAAGIGECCDFLGKVADGEMVRMYQAADVFIFPNSPQTWGLAVFEAMACGTPVVVSKGAGASEVLTNGTQSILVEPGRPDQIAAAIRRLAMDPAEWGRLSVAGRKFAEENIRWDIYASRMRQEMRDLCRL